MNVMNRKEGRPADSRWFPHLQRVLASMHDSYNPDNGMLRRPFSSPGYHTTIKQAEFAYPIRDTTDYALGLLDEGDAAYRERAYAIIRQVISLQDQNTESATYGIWSWFWEEPLAKMSPPDWNWADFIGKRLLLILIRHGGVMPGELRELVADAVRHCCESIIRRNVGPEYTNIAIMGTFVTLVGGEVLQDGRIRNYGITRLQRLHAYTMQSGSFLEYNSPAYGIVCIVELSGLVAQVSDEESLQLAGDLLELTWTMIAEHFHAGTLEWAGPHARSYDTFLKESRLSFLYMACEGTIPFVDEEKMHYELEWYGNGIRCPERLLPLLTEPGTRELLRELPQSGEFRTRTAYTYMTPSWTLGSFNHGIMWNQCRNLLAFAGSSGADHSYVRLRVLHDGYDYCSAVYIGEQREGNALFGIRFALDGGDTHPNLDPADGRIAASDLRIRLEIGSKRQAPVCSVREGREACVRFEALDVEMRLQFLHGEASGLGPFRLERTEADGVIGLDVVLYSGATRDIDFHEMERVLFLFALSLGQPDEGPDAGIRLEGDGTVTAMLGKGEAQLILRQGGKPLSRHELFHEAVQT
ncbi:hypothetical protein WMW72_02980 [Paenibacillus filicis]|uniref:Heparin-sulfate lyase N-terminal domain-containing protein n=1 Tax=Paenibacillus filicis TaxID=669464 RepID=A0ABU9DDD7_9BACL